jgi:hypothetical protein
VASVGLRIGRACCGLEVRGPCQGPPRKLDRAANVALHAAALTPAQRGGIDHAPLGREEVNRAHLLRDAAGAERRGEAGNPEAHRHEAQEREADERQQGDAQDFVAEAGDGHGPDDRCPPPSQATLGRMSAVYAGNSSGQFA